MSLDTAETATEKRPSRDVISFFSLADSVDLMGTDMITEVTGDPEAIQGMNRMLEAGGLDGSVNRIILRHREIDGYDIVYTWFKPGMHVPRHGHDTACTYFVLSGELKLGNKTLYEGDGVFVPPEHAYLVGSDLGAEIIEFRHSVHFDVKCSPGTPEYFSKYEQAAAEHRAAWQGMVELPTLARREAWRRSAGIAKDA
jgi:hypothetical protein